MVETRWWSYRLGPALGIEAGRDGAEPPPPMPRPIPEELGDDMVRPDDEDWVLP